MLLNKKYRSMMKKKDKVNYDEWSQELEKNDVFAMIIAGLLVIVPTLLIAFGIIGAFIWFFYFR